MATTIPQPALVVSRQQQWDAFFAKYFNLWLTLVVVIVGVGGFFILRGPYAEWRNLSAVRALQGQLQAYRNSLATLSSEITAWQQLDATSRGQVDIMLPSSSDLPNLLTELEAVAAQAGFQVQALGVGENQVAARGQGAASVSATPGATHQVQVTMSLANGSYPSFKRLVSVLRRAWRVLRLDSFSFSSDSDAYRVQLTAFYYPSAH